VGSLVTVSRELSRYKLDLVGVQVRWEGGGTEPAEEYMGYYRNSITLLYIRSFTFSHTHTHTHIYVLWKNTDFSEYS
jgi:hypothetical protein